MRYRGVWMVCLAALLALAAPARSDDSGGNPPNPSLEYRPPRPLVPEPRQLTPAPPVTIFRESLGSFGIGAGSFDQPVDLVSDKDANLYVLDSGNNRVQMFNSYGNFVLEWGTFGSRNGEFQQPGAIALDRDGYLYVVDSGNHRIQKFKPLHRSGEDCPDGKAPIAQSGGERICFFSTWGSLGSHSGDFKTPLDITFDDDGNCYVLDAGNERVQKFQSAGSDPKKTPPFLAEMGRYFGSKDGVFTDLVSLAWSDERFGYLYLLGGPGCTVQQFETNGTLRQSWSAAAPDSGSCVPARIEADNKNDILFIVDSGNGLLMRFTEEGRFLTAVHGAERTFSKPAGVSVQEDRGEIAVADTGNNIVQKFTIR